ncbi:2,5-diketo-d-gluconic acid reductase a [Clostridium botulinum Bf]|nr:2,5-diketo-d-gluconic acid reductase a [Clostridium botulinum Bf]
MGLLVIWLGYTTSIGLPAPVPNLYLSLFSSKFAKEEENQIYL